MDISAMLGQGFSLFVLLLPYSVFLVLGFLGIKALLKYLNDSSGADRK